MATGGVIGMIAAFLQTTEKITLLQNKDAILTCDLNSVFSCTSVLSAWQSSVFGFPNSLMCLILFNWGWMRLDAADLPIGEHGRAFVKHCIETNIDTIIWILLGLAVAFAMLLRFS